MRVLTPTVLTYIKVVILVAGVPAIVGFVIVLAERRFMGFMQIRLAFIPGRGNWAIERHNTANRALNPGNGLRLVFFDLCAS